MAVKPIFLKSKKFDARKSGNNDPRMPIRSASNPNEENLPYGKKGYEQGEGVDVRPGTFDRNTMNPENEEDEYPRQLGRNFDQGHLRSPEDKTSSRSRTKKLARML